MNRFNKILAFAMVSWGIMAGNASALISIDTVAVGNAGNPNDTTGYGSVGYTYGIGTYEVTLSQYCAFLNSVAASDTYSLYNVNMGVNANIAGITRSGVSGSYTYSVTGSGSRPVTYVSWYDSARFVNWLQNGQPTGGETAATTEQGAYTLNGAMSGIISRNTDVLFGLPTENEWYKAAYYQPAAQGGDTDGYWLYPTARNTQPNSRNGSASDPNSANFLYDDGIVNGMNGGYAVSQLPTYYSTQQYLTGAGAFSLAHSFYGTYDQGGNVWEWNDGVIGSNRGERGGSWANLFTSMGSGNRGSAGPSSETSSLGFRIVTIPEPGVMGFLALGIALLAWNRKRTL